MWWPRPLIGPAPDTPVIMKARDLPGWYNVTLVCLVGFFWLCAYVLAIRRARVDKRSGLPVIAVGLDVAWEFSYSLIVFQAPDQRPFDFAWFLLDLIIMRQALRYGPKDYPALSRLEFRKLFFAILGFSLILLPAVTIEINDYYGGYTGFGANCFVSLAFILMLQRRGSSAGQSMYIALSKLIGSVAAMILTISQFPHSRLFPVLCLTTFVLDVTYATMLHRQIRAEGASPWAFNRPPVTVRVPGASDPAPPLPAQPAPPVRVGGA